jgi:uncharacterized membrane protein (UPF0127 family)
MIRRKVFTFLPLLVLSLSACAAQSTTAPDMQFDTVNATIKDKPFTLEIADTPAKRERGLMFRNSMPPDHGMIFIFEVADNYQFWMKNTLIPLDIVFLDAKGNVIEIEARKANDETSMGPNQPESYVVELNAGVAANIGLTKGDHIDLPQIVLKRSVHSDEK